MSFERVLVAVAAIVVIVAGVIFIVQHV